MLIYENHKNTYQQPKGKSILNKKIIGAITVIIYIEICLDIIFISFLLVSNDDI